MEDEDELPQVFVKDLIEYLKTLPPNALVLLDKDGWAYENLLGVECIKQDGTIQFDKKQNVLWINN